MVEMAAVMPFMALLLLAGTDLGRLFYASVAVVNAARAGAQYGAHSLITAADSTGMQGAAQNEGSNVSHLTATANQCTCMSSVSVTACGSSYCTNNAQATFVEVDTAATFSTLITYPGIPSSIPLSGKAIMRVEQ
jgi:Flp pilus assembly protein TadG